MKKYVIWHNYNQKRPLFKIYMPDYSDKVNVRNIIKMFGRPNIYTIVACDLPPLWSRLVYSSRIIEPDEGLHEY